MSGILEVRPQRVPQEEVEKRDDLVPPGVTSTQQCRSGATPKMLGISVAIPKNLRNHAGGWSGLFSE